MSSLYIVYIISLYMSKLENTILPSCHGAGAGGGVATKEPALKICHCYVAALLLDALPSFYYVMCGVFAVMPA